MKRRLQDFGKIYVALLLCFVSLLIVLISGMWKAQPQQRWQQDSELLVWGRIDESQRKGIFSKGGLLRGYSGLGEDYMIAPELYVQEKLPAEADSLYCRQSGAQGTFFTLVAIVVENTVGREFVPEAIWGINSVLFVWVMLLLSWWLFLEFGWGGGPWQYFMHSFMPMGNKINGKCLLGYLDNAAAYDYHGIYGL